ncbi:hypothetical protein EXIGLDRAFT_705258 [Exidia glandulosa HHB12029]|uniref:Uncharacterized protein n=1 Tax=Exidia glandulosa HHB12029 TaxID=1314781 RepID=A0A165PTK2_EXIGL|nr:hypothetical protein EXIGLDRAFT_705258 [Exidia glandulosa HHB12029]
MPSPNTIYAYLKTWPNPPSHDVTTLCHRCPEGVLRTDTPTPADILLLDDCAWFESITTALHSTLGRFRFVDVQLRYPSSDTSVLQWLAAINRWAHQFCFDPMDYGVPSLQMHTCTHAVENGDLSSGPSNGSGLDWFGDYCGHMNPDPYLFVRGTRAHVRNTRAQISTTRAQPVRKGIHSCASTYDAKFCAQYTDPWLNTY